MSRSQSHLNKFDFDPFLPDTDTEEEAFENLTKRREPRFISAFSNTPDDDELDVHPGDIELPDVLLDSYADDEGEE